MNTKSNVVRFHTDEYDKFVLIDENRVAELMKPLQNKLKESMRKNGFFACRPVLTRALSEGRFLIIDGQNRFYAARDLSIPFYYEVDDTVTEAQLADLQISADWMPKDWIHMHVVKKNSKMIFLDKLMKQYTRVSPGILVGMLMGNFTDAGVGYESIKEGNIDTSHSTQTEFTLKQVQAIYDILPPMRSIVWTRPFLKALLKLSCHKRYKSKRMFDKICSHHEAVFYPGIKTVENWTNALVKVYNYRCLSKEKESFDI